MTNLRKPTEIDVYEFVRGADYGEEAFSSAVRSAWRGLVSRSPDLRGDCLTWLRAWTDGLADSIQRGPL